MRSQPRAISAGEPRCDRRIAVAHRPVDHEVRTDRRQRGGELVGLRAGDGLERELVALDVPDLAVVLGFDPRPDRQDDAVEHGLPDQPLVLDHPRVGQEFLEIAPHRRRVGGVRGAEIDQQHADRGRGGFRQRRRGRLRSRRRDRSATLRSWRQSYAMAAAIACVVRRPADPALSSKSPQRAPDSHVSVPPRPDAPIPVPAAGRSARRAVLARPRPRRDRPDPADQDHVRPGQRHLHHGRQDDAGRQAPRRLRPACRGGEGRTRAGQGRRQPRGVRACRRHAVALADVGARPRRPHHHAHQHDPARHLRAGQSRIRFRQGHLLSAHGGGEVSALRRQPADRRRQAAAEFPGPLDRDVRRRADRAHRHHLRRHAAHVEPRRPAYSCRPSPAPSGRPSCCARKAPTSSSR